MEGFTTFSRYVSPKDDAIGLGLERVVFLFGLSWEVIYAWAGYDFWGVILSVVSAIYAFRASRNAKLATDAATKAIQAVSSVEAVAELGKLLRILKEIRWRLDKKEWDRVSETCSDALSLVVPLQSTSSVDLSEDGVKDLESMAKQFAWLSKLAHKAQHEQGAIDLVKVKNMLGKSTTKAKKLEVELKESAAKQ